MMCAFTTKLFAVARKAVVPARSSVATVEPLQETLKKRSRQEIRGSSGVSGFDIGSASHIGDIGSRVYMGV